MNAFPNFCKVFLINITLLMISYCSHSQTLLNTAEERNAATEQVMEFLSTEDITKAFGVLKKHIPFPEEDLETMEFEMKENMDRAAVRFGSPIGYAFVREQSIDDLAIYRLYVLKFEKTILRVQFFFYKNNRGWIMNNFNYDSNLDKLFDE